MVTFDIPCYFHMFDHLDLQVLQAMISYFPVDVESCSDGELEFITKSRIDLSLVSPVPNLAVPITFLLVAGVLL